MQLLSRAPHIADIERMLWLLRRKQTYIISGLCVLGPAKVHVLHPTATKKSLRPTTTTKNPLEMALPDATNTIV